MDLDEKIFMKTIYDEIGSLHNFPVYQINNRIRGAAMVDGGLKNLSVGMKINLSNYVEDLKSAVNRYANHKKITDKSFKEQLMSMMNDVKTFIDEVGLNPISTFEKRGIKPTAIVNVEYKPYTTNIEVGTAPISNIVDGFKRLIKTCDHNITFINTTYNLRPDPRYGETSISRIMSEQGRDGVFCITKEFDWNNIEEMEKTFKSKGVELFSPEYGKLITKRLRAFKAEVISSMNKYFGSQSVFAEFKIPELTL